MGAQRVSFRLKVDINQRNWGWDADTSFILANSVGNVYDGSDYFGRPGATCWLDLSYVLARSGPRACAGRRRPVRSVVEALVGLDWLVVSGHLAQLSGRGWVRGTDGHRFVITALDGHPDRVRVQLWSPAGALVYDSQPGVPEGAEPTTPVEPGHLVIGGR